MLAKEGKIHEKIEKGIANIERIRRILAAQTSNRIVQETGSRNQPQENKKTEIEQSKS